MCASDDYHIPQKWGMQCESECARATYLQCISGLIFEMKCRRPFPTFVWLAFVWFLKGCIEVGEQVQKIRDLPFSWTPGAGPEVDPEVAEDCDARALISQLIFLPWCREQLLPDILRTV